MSFIKICVERFSNMWWFSSSEKDVNRTDRTNKFYEGQDNPGLILLHDILMTYCMYDFDLGKFSSNFLILKDLIYINCRISI